MKYPHKEEHFSFNIISLAIVLTIHLGCAYLLMGASSAQLEMIAMASEDLSEGASKGGDITFVSIDGPLNPAASSTEQEQSSTDKTPEQAPSESTISEPIPEKTITEEPSQDTPSELAVPAKITPPAQKKNLKPQKKPKSKEPKLSDKKTLPTPNKPKNLTSVGQTKNLPNDIKASGISHGNADQAGHGGTSDLAKGKQGDGKDATTSASHRGNYLRNPKPPYPAMSIEKGEEGTVSLRVVVEPDGSPSHVEVIKSSGYRRLDRSALETVRKHYRFIPAKRLGSPIQSTYSFSINFSLRDL